MLGVAALFASASWRLGARGVETILAGPGTAGWIALVVLTVLFVWGEGDRVLRKRYAPFVVARARGLDGGSPVVFRVLAPLYLMGLVGERRSVMLRAWLGSLAIVAAVLLVRALPEPWRGVTDFAVAAALVWGLVGVLTEARRILA